MTASKLLATTAIAIALTAGPSRADECDGIITALNKYAENLMKQEAKKPTALCAGFGQLTAISRAIREVADQCMEEGEKRTALLKDMDETGKVYQGEVEKCQ